jgi:hypothetical protein
MTRSTTVLALVAVLALIAGAAVNGQQNGQPRQNAQTSQSPAQNSAQHHGPKFSVVKINNMAPCAVTLKLTMAASGTQTFEANPGSHPGSQTNFLIGPNNQLTRIEALGACVTNTNPWTGSENGPHVLVTVSADGSVNTVAGYV